MNKKMLALVVAALIGASYIVSADETPAPQGGSAPAPTQAAPKHKKFARKGHRKHKDAGAATTPAAPAAPATK